MTPAEFKLILPVFKDAADPLVQTWLTASDEAFNEARWGGWLNLYRAYWVAHMIVVNSADKAVVEGNDTTMHETDNLKFMRSEALLVQQDENDWKRTLWGKRYFSKAREIGMGGAAV